MDRVRVVNFEGECVSLATWSADNKCVLPQIVKADCSFVIHYNKQSVEMM